MSSTPASARLVLPAIHCLARVGVSDEEAATPQPLLVSVTLSFSILPAAVHSDVLAETVDYAPLVEVVTSTSRSRRFRLLESLARDVHVALRAHLGPDFPLWVEVEKARPPLPALRQSARFGLGELLGGDARCSRCDATRAEPVVRRALMTDCDRLRDLIETSSRASTRTHYSTDEIAGALQAGIWGVDRALVRDGTCYLVEAQGEVVATGSWSRRTTFFGSDATSNRATEMLDPATDGARLRAFFVHPEYSGRGFGTALLRKCEREAVRAGFRRLDLVATLSGEGFYRSQGFVALEPVSALLPSGGTLTFVRMAKHAFMADPFGRGFCLLKADEAALELAASPYVAPANSKP